MKTFIAATILAIVFFILGIQILEAWDRTCWPNLTVIEQRDNIIVVKLDAALTKGTDLANQQAGQAVLEICEDGYSVMVTNWSAVADHEIIDLPWAERLAEGY